MSELENEIQEIEVTIEELEKQVAREEVLRRLMKNKDFQQIIEEEYFIQESSRMLLLRDDPNLPDDKRKFLRADMYGPGALKRYLSVILTQGMIASNQIEELKNTMDELNQADLEGED